MRAAGGPPVAATPLQRFFDDLFVDDDRFFEDRFFELDRFDDDFLLGTFPPFARASESPMAIACLRLVTFFPELLLSVPFFFLCNALLTRFCELFP